MASLEAANLFNVDNLVAVITGGGTGIGLMMAKALEHNGAKVYVIGRRMEVLEKAAQHAKNGNIIPLQGDVTKKEDLSRIVDTITASDGYINVLIANSGISGPGVEGLKQNPSVSELREHFWKTSFEEFTNTYAVNTSAVFFVVIAFVNLLEAGNKRGNVEQKSQVIATSSIGAHNRLAMAGYAYSTSKAAVTHMMKQFATSFAPYGIRSNVIAPGLYPSELADGPIAKLSSEDGIPASIIPLRRSGAIQDMAGAILYMTSKAGGYLNGNVLVTDGGRLSIVPSTY